MLSTVEFESIKDNKITETMEESYNLSKKQDSFYLFVYGNCSITF